MTLCDFLKRDGKVCGTPGARGGKRCSRHLYSVPFKKCEGPCGKVVSKRHGRHLCTKCDPTAAKAQSDARRRSNVTIDDIYSDGELDAVLDEAIANQQST